MKALLKFLASMNLAIYLLTAMAGMYCVAVIYGDMNVYTSWLFNAVLIILWFNLFFCTLKHIVIIVKTFKFKAKNISGNISGYKALNVNSFAKLSICLKEKGYKLDISGNETKIKACKNKMGLLAPQILHIAILTILVGAALTSTGVSGAVICAPGQSVQLPKVVREALGEEGEKYKLTVDDFVTVYDETGAVDNWIATLSLTNPMGEVKNGEAKVNHPFKYDKMTIYQNSYKYQYLVEIKGSDSAGTYSLPDNQAFNVSEDVLIKLNAMTEDEIVLSITNKDKTTHTLLKVGDLVEIYEGVTLEYGGKNSYTILEVKYEPGTMVVFLGFILAVIASFAFMFGRYKELRLCKVEDKWYVQGICKNYEMLSEDMNALTQLED